MKAAKRFLQFVLCASLGTTALSASAVSVTQLYPNPPGVSTWTTDPANAGDSTVGTWLYNVANAAGSPYNVGIASIGSSPDLKVNQGDTAPAGFPSFGANVLNLTLPVSGYEYLVLHWGGQGGGVWQAFYLDTNPVGSSFAFTAPGQNGLSSYAYYSPSGDSVPDGGSTLALLGAALSGLSLAGYRIRRLIG